MSSRGRFWLWVALLLLILGVSYWGGLWDFGRPTAPTVATVPLTNSPALPSATPAAPGALAPASPSFDVVRLNPEGMLVMAGRAAPGATVTVLDGAAVIAEAKADARGEWVIATDTPLAPGTRELRLVARLSDGRTIPAAEPLALTVPERARQTAVAAAPAPPDAAGSQSATGGLGGAGSGGISGPGGLMLDAVTYGEGGKVVLSGRAGAGGTVTAYLGERAIGEAAVGPNGAWRLSPEAALPPGLHSLRLEHTDAGRRMVGRIEIPFSQAASVLVAPGQTLWVVQPGNSLWRISRRTYGGGQEFERIYVANREQIRDPDLIYPGQVFTVPERR